MAPARRHYDADLTDGQRELILHARAGVQLRKATSRKLAYAVLFFLRAGAAWQRLTHDLRPGQTVYYYLRR